MATKATTAILLERAAERLRQERETFEQRKRHSAHWFYLQLAMGVTSICLLVAITIISSYVLINSATYSAAVVTAAGAALFVDVLGLLISVWKIVLNPPNVTRLAPSTEAALEALLEPEKPEIQRV